MFITYLVSIPFSVVNVNRAVSTKRELLIEKRGKKSVSPNNGTSSYSIKRCTRVYYNNLRLFINFFLGARIVPCRVNRNTHYIHLTDRLRKSNYSIFARRTVQILCRGLYRRDCLSPRPPPNRDWSKKISSFCNKTANPV